MQRMKYCIFWWLICFFMFHIAQDCNSSPCKGDNNSNCNNPQRKGGNNSKCNIPPRKGGNNSNCKNPSSKGGNNSNCNNPQRKGGNNSNCNNPQRKGHNNSNCNNPQRKGGNNSNCNNPQCKGHNNSICKTQQKSLEDAKYCVEQFNNIIKNKSCDTVNTFENMERVLEETQVNKSTHMSATNFVVYLHKPNGSFNGLQIFANESRVATDEVVPNHIANVQVPREVLDDGELMNATIVFCKMHLPNMTLSSKLLGEQLFGLSVAGKKISGLKERINITINCPSDINMTQKLQCVFLKPSPGSFSNDGCLTLWEHGQKTITCSCDHLTYFGVLLVSASEVSGGLSAKDEEILSYITVIGCSVSLLALVVVVLLFVTIRKARADDARKIHVSLAVALILLNVHFLPSNAVANMNLPGLCQYMAAALHYSLLASFAWMALEAFHLYLLLIKVFNIYVRRYLLKLSVVGWGVPAVIVSLLLSIDKNWYGHVPLDWDNPNSTAICYIANDYVKVVTTMGVFGLVFLFNLTIFGVTAKWVVTSYHNTEFGQSIFNRAKQEICTLLTVFTLLGLSWGLIFFSFGHLTTPFLYAFCILNSLQGFFLFLYFVFSLKKTKDSQTSQLSTETHSSRA